MSSNRTVYTGEFKRDALALWKSTDRSATKVEKELGLPNGTLYRWKKQLKKEGEEAFPGQGKLKPTDERIRKLERELAIVKEQRDILKKTIQIFSNNAKEWGSR